MAFKGPDLSLSYVPEFMAKTESERNPLPRTFLVKSLSEFVGALPEERLLCPVLAVRAYLYATSSLSIAFPFEECLVVFFFFFFFFVRPFLMLGLCKVILLVSLELIVLGGCYLCCLFAELVGLQGVKRQQFGDRIQFLLVFILKICLTLDNCSSLCSLQLARLFINFFVSFRFRVLFFSRLWSVLPTRRYICYLCL